MPWTLKLAAMTFWTKPYLQVSGPVPLCGRSVLHVLCMERAQPCRDRWHHYSPPQKTPFPWPLRVSLGEVGDGLLGVWPFQISLAVVLAMKVWLEPCPHLLPPGASTPPQLWALHTHPASMRLHCNRPLTFYWICPNLSVHTSQGGLCCRVKLCFYSPQD